MSYNVENMLMEHLNRFQATLEHLESKQEEAINRLEVIDQSVADLIETLPKKAGYDMTPLFDLVRHQIQAHQDHSRLGTST
jgi:hypothetical protein